ncbi:MAG: helix-turn-helix transcriptional regulator [Rhodobacter sp.]|nr:helix-turn-helix transcriptional regulator [Paracoccaceae bacterium]MCC0078044.1 helix-turn-helix transcriptional regulator [Rhodobacter sp.]
MSTEPRLDIVGAALADPSRARILCALMDGRAFTNKELALAGGVTPQTASAHLRRLEGAGLTQSLRSGRHVYHRLAGEQVAAALEALSALSPTDHLRRAGGDIGAARSCYNHLAGRLGVAMTGRLAEMAVIDLADGSPRAGTALVRFCTDLGIAQPRGAVGGLCLDWTERRHHLSGPLATAILARMLEQGWLQRRVDSRALAITPAGQAALARYFGLEHFDL